MKLLYICIGFNCEKMKPLIVITAAISIILPACANKEHATEQVSLMEASRQELATAIEERDQLLSLMKDISVSMDRIKYLEQLMTVSGTHVKESPSQRSKILADITSVQRTLKERREKLSQLESQLEQSALYTDELKSTVNILYNQISTQSKDIASLRNQLSKANETIDSLSNTVDSLNITVATINDDLDSAQEKSEQLTNELNACYYAIATKSELKEHQIIETGFLRKSKLMKGDFDRGFFNISDKRTLNDIDTRSGKIKILTNHPSGSYEIKGDGSNKTVRILEPDRFWSLTNYLVIQTD